MGQFQKINGAPNDIEGAALQILLYWKQIDGTSEKWQNLETAFQKIGKGGVYAAGKLYYLGVSNYLTYNHYSELMVFDSVFLNCIICI